MPGLQAWFLLYSSVSLFMIVVQSAVTLTSSRKKKKPELIMSASIYIFTCPDYSASKRHTVILSGFAAILPG
jgi:hypothetical protein